LYQTYSGGHYHHDHLPFLFGGRTGDGILQGAQAFNYQTIMTAFSCLLAAIFIRLVHYEDQDALVVVWQGLVALNLFRVIGFGNWMLQRQLRKNSTQ